MIISNSSPLILLTKINKLDIIKTLYSKIFIPRGVYKEVVEIGKEERYSDAFIIEKQINEFIFIKEIRKENLEEVEKLKNVIGRGEAEAIVLATQEKTNLLLMDNLEPRKIAKIRKIKCRSTPGILLEALSKNKIGIDEYKNSIIKLAEYAWLSGDIVAYFLDQAYKPRRKK